MNEQFFQDLLQTNGEASPFAGLTKLNDILPTLMTWSVVILVITVLFMIIMTVSRMRSQAATVAMQKDIRLIRQLLEQRAEQGSTASVAPSYTSTQQPQVITNQDQP